MLSWAGAEVAELRAWCCLCLGQGRGAEGREVAVLHNSTFQFLNAGHSLTEISSRRLSLANYCLAYPPLALLARSGQSYSIHREKQTQNSLYINPLVLCLESGTVLGDMRKYGITDGSFLLFELCNLQNPIYDTI